MTLATKLWVTSPLTIDQREELWLVGRELIYRFSGRPGPAVYTDKPVTYSATEYAPGTRDRDHEIGQGFCSMYDFRYHPLGLPAHPALADLHDPDWCDDPCEDPHEEERMNWYVRIDLDTSYGFHAIGPNGEDITCSHLHAIILYGLGQYLDAEGISWSWYNEYNGEINQGKDRLYTLPHAGREANAWFHNVVQPVIDAEAAATGAKVEWA